MRVAGVVGSCLVVLAFSATAVADDDGEVDPWRPKRAGFTSELGLGLAYTHVGAEHVDAFGLAPLSGSVGLFVDRDIAFMLRAAGTSYFEPSERALRKQSGQVFFGLCGQYWLSDRWFLGAGMGVGVHVSAQGVAGQQQIESGAAFTARAGWNFLARRHHAFGLVLEVFPGVYGRHGIIGTALNLEWQYY